MEPEKENIAKPPYISPIWVARFLEKARKVKVTTLDSEFIKTYEIAPPGNEGKVVTALKFFGVVHSDGSVDQDILTGLRLEGDAHKAKLKEVIEKAYSKLFSELDVAKCDSATLRNYFIGQKMTQSIAKGAATLFVFLCNEAGIGLSEDLKKRETKEPKKSGESKKMEPMRTRRKFEENKAEKELEKNESNGGGGTHYHYHFHFDKETPKEIVEAAVKGTKEKNP